MDFETTAPTNNCLNPEQKKMFLVSYTIVFEFHPKSNLNRVVVQASFGHSYKKLTIVNYFTKDQMEFVNTKLIKQLKDCTINVSQRKCKNAFAQMFYIELKFVTDCLLPWFNKKFKSQNL